MENWVERFIKFLEELSNKGESTLNLTIENDKIISFQGEIPKDKLKDFLNAIYEEGYIDSYYDWPPGKERK